jgi:predicted 3-demethylubiquinone-9 3-methyltransferase (glyoxalase superfamily)
MTINASSQKITTCLWFNGQAEEAMNFYVSVFKNSKVLSINRYGKNSPMPEGTVLTANFELDGRKFTALNGGPMYKFSPATSFIVSCDNQEEVDDYWDKLVADGKPNQCAWLDDKFGVTWQIVPKQLMTLLSDPDPIKAQRVMQAMFKMTKIIIADLQAAYDAP